MTDQQIANPKVHDMGGEPGGGPIDKAEHEVTFWEQRVDAMLVLLVTAICWRAHSVAAPSFDLDHIFEKA